MDNCGRRDFIKIGAVSSGVFAGSGMKKSHAAKEDRTTIGHSHLHKSIILDNSQTSILKNGLSKLLEMTEGLSFKPLPSEKFPYPLTQFAYNELTAPEKIIKDVKAGIKSDPTNVLENALALLELYESNQPGIEKIVPHDMKFFNYCFNSKRMNGWIAMLGNASRNKLESTINDRWQFRFFNEGLPITGVYTLLNMLLRYALLYGRTHYSEDYENAHFMDEQCPGELLDSHEITHFIDEFCPGLLVCRGEMTDLEMTISLMAMKIGVPAIVPSNYPFPLGKTVRTDSMEEIAESVVLFPNIRRLLDFPYITPMPSYCDAANTREKVKPHNIWGDTDESFYIMRKGNVETSGFNINGNPDDSLGIVVTIDAEPMDAFDCQYIERIVIRRLSMMKGVEASYDGDRVIIEQAKKAHLEPAQIEEVLVAAVYHDFPKLKKVYADIIFDKSILSEMAKDVKKEKAKREQEMASTTEENMDRFYSCVGCSPFAPNHMCVLTPERPPQCGRPFGMIKTGALYAYDDMTNIHHSIQHRMMNSFQTFDKGKCLDPLIGEWSGSNEQVRRLTHGRTRRVLLHTLKDNPHTGCGCFHLIIFETDKPRKGIGIMNRSFKGKCPDGRSWLNLHYELGGKQTPGFAGASSDYLFSKKFIQADGGWKSVVWVSPKIGRIMGDKLPHSVKVG